MSEDSQSQNIKRLQGHLTLNANEFEISGAILKLLKQKEKTEKWLDFFFFWNTWFTICQQVQSEIQDWFLRPSGCF